MLAWWETAWALSVAGTWLFAITLALYAYYEHGPVGVGLAVAARMLPAGILAGLPALIGRRWSPRRAVLASAVGRFVVLEAIALIVLVDAPFAVLLAAGAVFELVGLVHRSARMVAALDAAVAPADLAVLGGGRLVTLSGLLAGAIASAVAVQVVSLQAAFAVAGLVFLPVAGIVSRLPELRGSAAARPPGSGHRTRRLVVLARERWLLLRLGLFGSASLVEATLDLLLVVVALDLVHAGDGGVGWLRTAFAVGGLLGARVALRSLRAGRLAAGVLSGLALAGIPLALIAAWPAMPTAVVLIGILGAGYVVTEAALQPLTLRLIEPADAADAASLEDRVYPLARAAGAGLGSWLVTQMGDTTAVIVVGLILPVIAVVGIASLHAAEKAAHSPARPLELLSRLPVLAALPRTAIENLALFARRETYPAGSTIARRNDLVDRICVIDLGEVESANEEHQTERLGPGSCFGEVGLLGVRPLSSTITVTSPLTVWTVARNDFIRSLGAPASMSVARAAREAAKIP